MTRSAAHWRSMSDGGSGTKFYLVGGGIASLAAAAFLIRDGDVPGHDITILEESDRLGGSLDGAGTPEQGYVLRGGRMLESKYLCTYDLFSSIPTLDESRTVTQEIFAWNETMKTSSKSRLFRDGHRDDAPAFGLSERQILTLERLAIEPEAMLGRTSIAEQFDASFFKTDFWLMWCTTFAFQPWHSAVEFKRYLVRFAHMVSGFNCLHGIMRTVYNQYDSMVRPLDKWLKARGVKFELGVEVTDLATGEGPEGKRVERILCRRGGVDAEILLKETDKVIVTLGSMTEGSNLGATDRAATLGTKRDGGAWTLWEKLAEGRPEFGSPAVFADHVDESKWLSFTTTLHSPDFFDLVRDLTGNVPGEGGLITFPQSNWLASIVLPHQPHFIGQPEGVQVLWGYGLFIDTPGNFVPKPMAQCSGREIMTEIIGHLGAATRTDALLATANCIPCMMPFITSQFLRRDHGDRPQVIPAGWTNLAFTGQYCEQPDDVVFTVEYSVRSAQTAAYRLLGLDRAPPAVFKGQYDPRVLYQAFRALHDMDA
ncbi:oleate hydratase [Sphingomonas panacis]|uniref:Oleate hydratase n=1 Tax=Sphingomonas panacis TaxID=1560345 RepID=A0A1B3Z6U4_9SPHN|nr:oleate hydratase [Sphingomonas panacis]AOH83142.1 oleate hydratase [Sphingomonas panacis]